MTDIYHETNNPAKPTCHLPPFSGELESPEGIDGQASIWSESDYRRFVAAEGPYIRSWALKRLCLFAPEKASAIALDRGILDDHPMVQLTALEVLDAAPADRMDDALRLYLETPDLSPKLRAMAIALWVRHGTMREKDLSQWVWPSSQQEVWEAYAASEPKSCRERLLAMLTAKKRCTMPLAIVLRCLAPIAECVDAQHLLAAVSRFDDEEEQRELASLLLQSAGAEDLIWRDDDPPNTFFSELFDLLDSAGLNTAAKMKSDEWASIIESLDKETWHTTLKIALDMLRQIDIAELKPCLSWTESLFLALNQRRSPTTLEMSITRALYVSTLRLMLTEHALKKGALDLQIRLLRTSSRRVAEGIGKHIIAQLNVLDSTSLEWKNAIDMLLEGLRSEAVFPGAYLNILHLIDKLKEVPLQALVDTASNRFEYVEQQYLASLLNKRPEVLRSLAAEHLAGTSTAHTTIMLYALQKLPYQWAPRLILDKLFTLTEGEEHELVWRTLQTLALPEVQDVGRYLWQPGEPHIAEAVFFVAKLTGREDELSETLVSDARQVMEQNEALFIMGDIIDHLKGLLSGPLVLPLVCNCCNRRGHYPVRKAVICPPDERAPLPGWDGIVLSPVIECKYCGAKDDYTLTHRAQLQLNTRMYINYANHAEKTAEQATKDAATYDVQIGIPKAVDGTKIRRLSEGLERARQRIEAAPPNSENWVQLAELCVFYRLDEQAESAFIKAIEMDPDAVDPVDSLADLLWTQERYAEGMKYVTETFARLPRAAVTEKEKEDLVHRNLEMVRAALKMDAAPMALTVGWEGAKIDDQPVVHNSSVDLRKIRNWEALGNFISSGRVIHLGFTPELPEEEPTQLQQLVDGSADLMASSGVRSRIQSIVRQTAKVGRNQPCPCGSGKKYKKCCGR